MSKNKDLWTANEMTVLVKQIDAAARPIAEQMMANRAANAAPVRLDPFREAIRAAAEQAMAARKASL